MCGAEDVAWLMEQAGGSPQCVIETRWIVAPQDGVTCPRNIQAVQNTNFINSINILNTWSAHITENDYDDNINDKLYKKI